MSLYPFNLEGSHSRQIQNDRPLQQNTHGCRSPNNPGSSQHSTVAREIFLLTYLPPSQNRLALRRRTLVPVRSVLGPVSPIAILVKFAQQSGSARAQNWPCPVYVFFFLLNLSVQIVTCFSEKQMLTTIL